MNAFTSVSVTQGAVRHPLHTHEVRRRIEFLTRHHMLSCAEGLLRLQASGLSVASALREVGAQRRLFHVQLVDIAYFPAFQWHHVQLRHGVGAVLEACASARTKWHIALWFVSSNELLEGLRPIDLLDQDPLGVAHAAARAAGRREVSH